MFRFLKTLLKSSVFEFVGLFPFMKLNPGLAEDSTLLLFILFATFVLLLFVSTYNNSGLDLLLVFCCSSDAPVDFPLIKVKPLGLTLVV